MKFKVFPIIWLCWLLLPTLIFAQNTTPPSYYKIDRKLSEQLETMVDDVGLSGDFTVVEDGQEQISFAVIELGKGKPKLAGVNYDNFIYPASVYKMYVAAEVLNQASNNTFDLNDYYVVKSPNYVDRSKELPFDPRPLLHHGDSVTYNYLLDLMITRSDNSAANCMIDIAQRTNINQLIELYNWQGSAVTRKFLGRKLEDSAYKDAPGTMTSALHAADFMYRVQTNQLINPWVSLQMKALLGRQLDKSKLAAGLPDQVMYYHKTGWWAD
jgi:beta-lactamase class A